jgi:hypothetical protein
VSGELVLLPNLGGEERSWRRTLHQPRVCAAAKLWRLLFSRAARMAPGDLPAPLVQADWPRELRDGSTAAAFEWLDAVRGCVPWLGNADAHADPACGEPSVWGASPEVVERVHDKAFAQRAAEELDLVPRVLRGTSVVFEPDELVSPREAAQRIERIVDSWPDWTGGRFTLKPRFGSSGRGRFDVRAGDASPSELRSALPRLAARGGAILEPWLARESDLSAQLRVTSAGDVFVLGTLQQILSDRGSYRGHCGEVDSAGRIFSGQPHDSELRAAAAAIAHSALAQGFRGPCGVDALEFRWRDASEWRRALRPVVELNARFTMGTVVCGLVRRAVEAVAPELGLRPGQRYAFEFRIDAPPTGWAQARIAAGDGAVLVPLACHDDPVQPALLFARTRPDLDRALDSPADSREAE